MSKIQTAVDAFGALNGVFCIYKPKAKDMFRVVAEMKFNFHRDLRQLPGPRLSVRRMTLPPMDDSNLPITLTVPDLTNHPRVIGDFVMPDDIKLSFVDPLHKFGTGVQLMGIADGCSELQKLVRSKLVRVYHITGELGYATDTYKEGGNLIERSTWHHVDSSRLDRVIAMIQATHQRHQYLLTGVDIQSQEAYNMAVSGMVRPLREKGRPIIYSVKCINFRPPHFTIEVHSVNEDMTYLSKLIHDIGLSARTTATCTGIRRVRYGNFTLDYALISKHFKVDNVLENIALCKPLMSKKALKPQRSLRKLEDVSSRLKISNSEQHLLDGDGESQIDVLGERERNEQDVLGERERNEQDVLGERERNEQDVLGERKRNEQEQLTDCSGHGEAQNDLHSSDNEVNQNAEIPENFERFKEDCMEIKSVRQVEHYQSKSADNYTKKIPHEIVDPCQNFADDSETVYGKVNRNSNIADTIGQHQQNQKVFRSNDTRVKKDYGEILGPRLSSRLVISKRLKKKKLSAS